MKTNEVTYNNSKIKIFGVNQFLKTDQDELNKEIMKMVPKPDAVIWESCEERAQQHRLSRYVHSL